MCNHHSETLKQHIKHQRSKNYSVWGFFHRSIASVEPLACKIIRPFRKSKYRVLLVFIISFPLGEVPALGCIKPPRFCLKVIDWTESCDYCNDRLSKDTVPLSKTLQRGIEPRSSAWQAEILTTILLKIEQRHVPTLIFKLLQIFRLLTMWTISRADRVTWHYLAHSCFEKEKTLVSLLCKSNPPLGPTLKGHCWSARTINRPFGGFLSINSKI